MSPGSLSRRDVLRQLALAATSVAAGGFNLEAARVVHAFAAGERAQAGGYAPRFLTVHEFATVSRLAELVVPADAGGGSAVDAGAPEFIDLLCSENERLAEIYRNGIAWLDDAMRLRAGGARVDGARGDGARRRRRPAVMARASTAGSSGRRPSGRRRCSMRWSRPSGTAAPVTWSRACASSPGCAA